MKNSNEVGTRLVLALTQFLLLALRTICSFSFADQVTVSFLYQVIQTAPDSSAEGLRDHLIPKRKREA